MEKMALFIDGGYFAKVLKRDHENARIDFEKLIQSISRNHELFRTYYYYCPIHISESPSEEEKEKQRKQTYFFQALRKMQRFEIRLGRLVKREHAGTFEFEQKRVDVLLSVDMVRIAWQNRIDKAVIIAGDDDFVPAVTDVKNSGVITVLYCSRNSYSRELYDVCDERYYIDNSFIESIKK